MAAEDPFTSPGSLPVLGTAVAGWSSAGFKYPQIALKMRLVSAGAFCRVTRQMKNSWWNYENLPSGEPYDWGGAARTDHPDDNLDFHLDLGAGRLPKGRLTIDRFDDPTIDIVMDLDHLSTPVPGSRGWKRAKEFQGAGSGEVNPMEGMIPVLGRLPFPSQSIESIITHHALEHIGDGFIRLMDECHRVLKRGGKMRVIVPLYPSHSAAADPDHKRYFLIDTFNSFMGDAEGNSWLESFSTPYTTARFKEGHKTYTARDPDPAVWWTPDDARELRITLEKQ